MRKQLITFLLLMAGITSLCMGKDKDAFKTAMAMLERKSLDSAAVVCKAILFEDPDDLDGNVLQGCILVSKGYLHEGIETLDDVIERKTKRPEAWVYRSYAHFWLDAKKKALEDINHAIDMAPKMYLVWHARGDFYFQTDHFAEAISDLKVAESLNPRSADIQCMMGLSYYYNESYSNSIQHLTDALALGFKRPEVCHVFIGRSHQRLGKFVLAEQRIDQALEINPDFHLAYLARGQWKLEAERWEEGLEYMGRVLALDSTNPYALYETGNALFMLERYEECLAWMDSIISEHTAKVPNWLLLRGNAKFAREEYDEAIKDYTICTVRMSGSHEPYERRGYARLALQQYSKAREDFYAALKLNEHAFLSRQGIILAFREERNFSKLKETCEEYLRRYPKISFGWMELGFAQGRLGDPRGAIESYRTALRLGHPDSAGILQTLAGNFLDLGDTVASSLLIDSCLALNPDSPSTLASLGYYLTCVGRDREALDILNQSIAKDSTGAYAFNNRGLAKLHLGMYAEAIRDFDKSIALKNDYTHWPPHFRGKALFALGRYQAAIDDYTLSLSYVPEYVEALVDRGLAYEKLGEKDKAIADLERALAIKPGYAPAVGHLARLKP